MVILTNANAMKKERGVVSGDAKGPGICSRDNRSLQSDLFSKGEKKCVLISASLRREAAAHNLVLVTMAGDCRSGDVV